MSNISMCYKGFPPLTDCVSIEVKALPSESIDRGQFPNDYCVCAFDIGQYSFPPYMKRIEQYKCDLEEYLSTHNFHDYRVSIKPIFLFWTERAATTFIDFFNEATPEEFPYMIDAISNIYGNKPGMKYGLYIVYEELSLLMELLKILVYRKGYNSRYAREGKEIEDKQ